MKLLYTLLEDAAYRCFDLACTDLTHLSPNCAAHLKSPKNDQWSLLIIFLQVEQTPRLGAQLRLLRERGGVSLILCGTC